MLSVIVNRCLSNLFIKNSCNGNSTGNIIQHFHSYCLDNFSQYLTWPFLCEMHYTHLKEIKTFFFMSDALYHVFPSVFGIRAQLSYNKYLELIFKSWKATSQTKQNKTNRALNALILSHHFFSQVKYLADTVLNYNNAEFFDTCNWHLGTLFGQQICKHIMKRLNWEYHYDKP